MSARRREIAAKRARNVLEMQVRWAFRNDSVPPSAIAVTSCSCGWVSWVMPGTPEELDEALADHAQASADHDYMHELDEWDDTDAWDAA